MGLSHAKEENCSWSLCLLSAQQPILAHGALEKTNRVSSALAHGLSGPTVRLSPPVKEWSNWCQSNADTPVLHREEPRDSWQVHDTVCGHLEEWTLGSLHPRRLPLSPYSMSSHGLLQSIQRTCLSFSMGVGRKILLPGSTAGCGAASATHGGCPFPCKSVPDQPRTF